MPVKLNSKLPSDNAEARIEIIPLIDIMFFLLAAFMLVSLSMVNLRSVKVNLPSAATADPDRKKDLIDITVDRSGAAYLDKTPVAANELTPRLLTLRLANPNLRLLISADRMSHHGDVLRVLDSIRSAGIDNVAFETAPVSQETAP